MDAGPQTRFSPVTTGSNVLPPRLLDALREIGVRLERGEELGDGLDKALDLLADLPPGRIAQADAAIASAANLRPRPPPSRWSALLHPRPTDRERLLGTPRLEYLFLFHRDGRLRQAALWKIMGALPVPFLFAAVLWRLNDWAAPVRAAAVLCARRSFPATDPAVVAQAAVALMVRQASWGRWKSERAILDEVLARDDVADHLAELIGRNATGPLASLLRHALRTPALDHHLDRIAFEAVQPSVRAVALHALIDGRVEWPSGHAWQWIDKSLGIRRKVTVFDQRDLSVSLSREALIARSIHDRSAVVRRVALNGIIRHLPGTAEGREHAARLVTDPSPSVRERAEFILRSGPRP